MRRLVEVGEDEVAAEQEIDGRVGNERTHVGMHEVDPAADLVADAIELAGAFEGLLAQANGQLPQAAFLVESDARALEHRLVEVRGDDRELDIGKTRRDLELPDEHDAVRLFSGRAAGAPHADASMRRELGKEAIAERVVDAVVAIEARDGDEAKAAQHGALGLVALEERAIFVGARDAELAKARGDATDDLAAHVLEAAPAKTEPRRSPLQKRDALRIGHATSLQCDTVFAMGRQDDEKWDLVAIARDVAEKEGFIIGFPGDARRAEPDDDASVADERHLLWSSVDNRESTDLDQVEVAERLADDVIRVKIGIADVDAYVPRGSALDKHAGANTTSLYAGIATFHMLPDDLSSGDTSLLPGQERLVVVTEIDVAKDGSIKGERIYRARVKNHAKLVYDDVGAWLEGQGEAPPEIAGDERMDDQVRMHDEAAQRLRKRRIDLGALQLETVEARAVAKEGKVVDLKLTLKSRARELVEDLMIAANGATARWLEERRFASIRRVVRKPRRWDRIVDIAKTHGIGLPAEPDARALSDFLKARREADPTGFADVSLSVVKLLGPGEYTVADPDSPEGHFGLAVDDYAHSTAPNRRYGDLVTQRLLKAAARGEKTPYPAKDLEPIAKRCTEREDHARKFERTMRKVAAALFLSRHIGKEYDAVVTGVSSKGTFVRLLAPPAEGRVVEGERGLDVGDHTRVRLVATEPTRGFIDFVRA